MRLRLLTLGIAVAGIAALSFLLLRDDELEVRIVPVGQVNWVDFYTFEHAVRGSDVIVIAEMLEERRYREETTSSLGRRTGDYRHVVERTFRVDETPKGDSLNGREISVGYLEKSERNDKYRNLTLWEYPPAEVGNVYVLFLHRGFDDRGREVLGPAGEPSIALVKGDQIEFQVTDRYRESVKALLSPVRLQGRPAPPTLLSSPPSLDQVRRATTLNWDELRPTPFPTPTAVPRPFVTPTVRP